ncbi:MAG: asparaginase [Firmicutes bacterium]|nr:asparaginase [Bacillota bacterium]
MREKTILVIFTGGTISMQKLDSSSKADITDNQKELLSNISSELKGIELRSHQFSLKPSPSVTPKDMFILAQLTDSYLMDSNIDGVVITHGTDTIEESAYFLDLYLETKKPVVFTGSMRSFSELGYDGLSNLVSSIRVAASPESIKKGVLLVMNDEINAASEVTKTHTLALDTFKSMEFGPIGIVDEENVLYYHDAHHRQDFVKPQSLTKTVEIVKAYSGSSSLILNLLIQSGIDGIVIEALGRGNVPPQMLDGIILAIEKGIPVVLTSRCPMGRVLDTYGYNGGGHHLKRLGVIFAENLSSQKARIKLLIAINALDTHQDIVSFFEN